LRRTIDAVRPAAVLIVDDDASLRLVARVNLELDGFRCLEAGNVADAELLLREEDVRVVVTDLKLLERGDGFGFARRVREERPEVGLVVVTGTTPPPAQSVDFADAFFQKPFDLPEFTQTVARLAAS
jgi:DNA-binding NtrC family response regulator